MRVDSRGVAAALMREGNQSIHISHAREKYIVKLCIDALHWRSYLRCIFFFLSIGFRLTRTIAHEKLSQ